MSDALWSSCTHTPTLAETQKGFSLSVAPSGSPEDSSTRGPQLPAAERLRNSCGSCRSDPRGRQNRGLCAPVAGASCQYFLTGTRCCTTASMSRKGSSRFTGSCQRADGHRLHRPHQPQRFSLPVCPGPAPLSPQPLGGPYDSPRSAYFRARALAPTR